MFTLDASKSRVLVETQASGLLAAIAHDLRIEAPIAEATSADGERCTARFDVANMKVIASSRHKTGAWSSPSPSDAKDIEGRIQRELFEGCSVISVEGTLDGARSTLIVRARHAQTVDVPIVVERETNQLRATGTCELSLSALGTGKVHVPFGAIKLVDRVVVTFDVVLISQPAT